MKKIVLSLSLFAFTAGAVFAQEKSAATATAQNNLSVKFISEIHDFGNIPQNKPVEHEFTFVNNGKTPVNIERVQASCGCTTPSYSKDPILPGKTGSVKAAYNAAAAGHFSKTVTVFFKDADAKVLTVKGNVEKAPESSVPQNNSVIKK